MASLETVPTGSLDCKCPDKETGTQQARNYSPQPNLIMPPSWTSAGPIWVPWLLRKTSCGFKRAQGWAQPVPKKHSPVLTLLGVEELPVQPFLSALWPRCALPTAFTAVLCPVLAGPFQGAWVLLSKHPVWLKKRQRGITLLLPSWRRSGTGGRIYSSPPSLYTDVFYCLGLYLDPSKWPMD